MMANRGLVRLSWSEMRILLDHSVALGIEEAREQGLTLNAKGVRLDKDGSVSGKIRFDSRSECEKNQISLFPSREDP